MGMLLRRRINELSEEKGENKTLESDEGEKLTYTDFPYSDKNTQIEEKGHLYTKDELEQNPVRIIKKIAEELGFTITKTIKDDVIQEFLEKQAEL